MRDQGRPYLSPLAVQGRLLRCRECEVLVDLIEIPTPWIDQDDFVCGLCLVPTTSDRARFSTTHVGAPEPAAPTPPMLLVAPRSWHTTAFGSAA